MLKTKQIESKDTEPKKIKINTKEYYLCDDLNTYDMAYFNGTHRNLRGIIEKKNIPES